MRYSTYLPASQHGVLMVAGGRREDRAHRRDGGMEMMEKRGEKKRREGRWREYHRRTSTEGEGPGILVLCVSAVS